MKSTDKVQSEIIENDNIREVHVKHVHNHYYHPSKRKYKKKEPETYKPSKLDTAITLTTGFGILAYAAAKAAKYVTKEVKQWRAKK